MPYAALNIPLLLPQFLMVLFRISGLALTAPLLSSPALPARLKVAFSFTISLMIFPIVQPRMPDTLTFDVVIVSVLGELMIGMVMGFALGLVFVGAQLVGMLIGQQAGFGLGRVINPMMEGQGTILGQMYFLVTMMIYLAIGGHRAMMAAILDTFVTLPPGTVQFSASPMMVELVEGLLLSAYTMAIKLAGPALIALFLASLVMGFISRTIPQINILSIGFAVRAVVALTAAGLSMSSSFDVIYEAIFESIDWVRDAFELGPV